MKHALVCHRAASSAVGAIKGPPLLRNPKTCEIRGRHGANSGIWKVVTILDRAYELE